MNSYDSKSSYDFKYRYNANDEDSEYIRVEDGAGGYKWDTIDSEQLADVDKNLAVLKLMYDIIVPVGETSRKMYLLFKSDNGRPLCNIDYDVLSGLRGYNGIADIYGNVMYLDSKVHVSYSRGNGIISVYRINEQSNTEEIIIYDDTGNVWFKRKATDIVKTNSHKISFTFPNGERVILANYFDLGDGTYVLGGRNCSSSVDIDNLVTPMPFYDIVVSYNKVTGDFTEGNDCMYEPDRVVTFALSFVDNTKDYSTSNEVYEPDRSLLDHECFGPNTMMECYRYLEDRSRLLTLIAIFNDLLRGEESMPMQEVRRLARSLEIEASDKTSNIIRTTPYSMSLEVTNFKANGAFNTKDKVAKIKKERAEALNLKYYDDFFNDLDSAWNQEVTVHVINEHKEY